VEEVKSMSSPASGNGYFGFPDHFAPHVYAELQIYSKFVTKGTYLVVEDAMSMAIRSGHPRPTPGTMEAVEEIPSRKQPSSRLTSPGRSFLVPSTPTVYLKRI